MEEMEDEDAEDVPFLPETQIKQYIREIETNESQFLGTTLREIYQKNLYDLFKIQLESRVVVYDEQIESICHHHYSKLSSAVLELRRICELVMKLRQQVVDINSNIQLAGREVIQANREFQHVQRQRRNLNLAVEHLEACLPLFQNYSRLEEQIKRGMHYRALKSINMIEMNDLDQIPDKVPLKKFVQNQLPKMKEKVALATETLRKDWLEKASSKAVSVGRRAVSGAGDELDELDFSPVFRCLHIATLDSARETFCDNFIQERNAQMATLVVSTTNLTQERIVEHVYAIVGFLVIEEELQSSARELSETVNQMWLKFEDRVTTSIRSYQSKITLASEYDSMKVLLAGFKNALQRLNLECQSVTSIQNQLREQFHEVLLARYAEYFDAIIEKDNFTPLLVSSVEEEFEIYSVFPFDRDVIGASFGVLESPGYSGNLFPKKLPFSRMVLRIFGQLKKFIDEYLEYCAGVEMNSLEIDEASRKALISLVRRPLRDSLKKLTIKDNVGLHQLMQLSINIGCLDSACTELCRYIRKSTLTPFDPASDSRSLSRLGSEAFKDIRSEIEMHIPKRFEAKLDEIIELGRDVFDFIATSDPTGPSEFIRSALGFLENNLKMLAKLSRRVQETTLFSVCLFLNRTLMEWLTDPDDPTTISMNAMRQLMIDLNHLEHFASEALTESAEASLAFVPIHQLLDLTIKNDWPRYFSCYRKADSPYLRISPQQARLVYQKLGPFFFEREGGATANGHASGVLNKLSQTRRDADRKKLYDETIRQLKKLEIEN